MGKEAEAVWVLPAGGHGAGLETGRTATGWGITEQLNLESQRRDNQKRRTVSERTAKVQEGVVVHQGSQGEGVQSVRERVRLPEGFGEGKVVGHQYNEKGVRGIKEETESGDYGSQKK